MKIIDKLNHAKSEMSKQKTLYQPTSFWADASEQIARELVDAGIDQFRRTPTALGYFVPNYSGSASGISPEQADVLRTTLLENFPNAKKAQLALEHFLSGAQAALADYRVLIAGDNRHQLPWLHAFSESTYGNPVEQFEWNGKRYSRSALNYLLGLSLLKRHLNDDIPRCVLEIGGGFGTLGEIWSQSGVPDWQYIDIDITPTQLVAEQFLKAAIGPDQVSGFEELPQSGEVALESLKKAAVLCPWQIEQLVGKVDLFVNFISFQEMEPEVVDNYLHHVNRLQARWILLRNLREGKPLKKSGHPGVKIPIKTENYVTMLRNYELIDSNVHPFGFQTVDGFHSELLLLKRKFA